MQNILTLPLCQVSDSKNNFKNYAKIDFINNESVKSCMHPLEALSTEQAKKALTKPLLMPKQALQKLKNLETAKEAIRIFEERNRARENLEKIINQLPANITDKPKFHEVRSEPVELSSSAKETFARIGERAREAFIEEQIERAMFYNISYESYGDNYYQLMIDIDKYEYLLEKANDYCIDWDSSEYDLVALEQAIEEAEHNAYIHDQSLRSYYLQSRGVEV